MEIVSSIVKDQLNRFIIEMGDFAMKKKTIIISGIAAVLVIGSVVFCFAVKGDSTQPADVAQTVTEAVATPTIEVTQETSEEVSEETSSEVSEPEVEVTEEPEVVEEAPVVEEVSETEGSIVDVAETSEEDEDAGVSTQTEEVKPVEPKQEEVKPAETKPVQTQPTESQPVQAQPQQTQPQQTTVDAQRDAILAQMKADGGIEGIPDSNGGLVDYSGKTNFGFEFE